MTEDEVGAIRRAIQSAPLESITRDCICAHHGHDDRCAAAYLAKLNRALAVEHAAFAKRLADRHRREITLYDRLANTSPDAAPTGPNGDGLPPGEEHDEQSAAARPDGESPAPPLGAGDEPDQDDDA